jgi:hypothetical protein
MCEKRLECPTPSPLVKKLSVCDAAMCTDETAASLALPLLRVVARFEPDAF